MIDPKKVPSAELFQKLNADESGYQKITDWLKLSVGIHMPPSPKNFTLMASRLSKVMGRLGVENYADLHRLLETGNQQIQKVVIEALTTNKTGFFREAHHFEVLPRAIQDVMGSKGHRSSPVELRIWCAAASRGQEPYSILFTLLECGFDPRFHRLKFLATDIDLSVLEAASKGVYLEDELTELPLALREKYMVKIRDGARGERWKVRDELRDLVTFARFNLVEFPYSFQHRFDIIFCRNVMIYFDQETILKVKDHLAQALAAEGYLFIGHSESGTGRIPALKSFEPAVFKRSHE